MRLRRPPARQRGPKHFDPALLNRSVCGVCGGTKHFMTTAKTECESCGNIGAREDV